jgi:hypothetical protein
MAANEDPAPAASLEALQREHALTRMRLAEAIGLLSGEQSQSEALAAELAAARAEHERLAAALAAADAERGRLSQVLAQDGHRLVTSAGSFLDRHPALRSLLRPLLRILLRLGGR